MSGAPWETVHKFQISLLLSAILAVGCGYDLEGTLRPAALKGVRTISISAFSNQTNEPGLGRAVTKALRSRFLQDGRLRLSGSPDADTALEGVLHEYRLSPIGFTRSDRVQQYRVVVRTRIRLRNKKSEKLLINQDLESFAEFPVSSSIVRSAANRSIANQQIADSLSKDVVSLILKVFKLSPNRKKPKSSLAAIAEVYRSPVQPIYLLAGNDAFLRDEYLRVIRRKVFGDEPSDFNHDRFDWPEAEASEIMTIAQTLPFLAEKRLIEVFNFARPGEKDESIFLSYLDQPADSTILVFCVENADMRTTFFQRLVKASVVCRVDILEGEDLKKWLHGRATELGFDLRPEAADMLVEMVKPSMMRLSTELEKIASYLMPGTLAGAEEIRELSATRKRSCSISWVIRSARGT